MTENYFILKSRSVGVECFHSFNRIHDFESNNNFIFKIILSKAKFKKLIVKNGIL